MTERDGVRPWAKCANQAYCAVQGASYVDRDLDDTRLLDA